MNVNLDSPPIIAPNFIEACTLEFSNYSSLDQVSTD